MHEEIETKYRLRNGLIVVRDDTKFQSGGGVRTVDVSGCNPVPYGWNVGEQSCLSNWSLKDPSKLKGGAHGPDFDVVGVINPKPTTLQRIWLWLRGICSALRVKKSA